MSHPSLLSLQDLAALRADIARIAREAGALAFEAFREGGRAKAEVFWKEGGSPVTSIDLIVDAMLKERLHVLAPGIAYHSEERPEDWGSAAAPRLSFVVDPIDGTRAFMDGRLDWCISIGVVMDGMPVIGVINVPARAQMYHAHRGGGASLNGIQLPAVASPRAPLLASGPKSMIEAYAPHLPGGISAAARIPSLAYRLIKPLTGEIDFAFARPGAHDWDIAGAHCILNEAGGDIIMPGYEFSAYGLTGAGLGPMIGGPKSLLERFTAPTRA